MRQAGLGQDSTSALDYGAVCAFSHAVLLRALSRRLAMTDAGLSVHGVPLVSSELASFIVLKDADVLASQPLCPRLVLHKGVKSIALVAQQINAVIGRSIIMETDEIAEALCSTHWHLHQIGVNELQNAGSDGAR